MQLKNQSLIAIHIQVGTNRTRLLLTNICTCLYIELLASLNEQEEEIKELIEKNEQLKKKLKEATRNKH